ncbi:NADH dehydrogenase [ubiquinone] 1 alpha subcomplex assembly factor 2 isoform X2 [Gadus chalcogrammus]|uniref:NADH dehydrogenase [ubiquinone] 1 alpha subcomplex assembly factor 2 isoform X2 n=1 Tax=Gadus chalcogrammus TaxID=1042646 RepID=UPI0024C44F82|nr:NADH dehydrogenase [ubiquinone] 1 alpha subcomplex assembly factor 2 isoform X2 [Gadus chalcogrammus]
MSRIAGLLKRTFWIVREHVGSDHLGNNYYMIPQQKTWTGRSVRAKRMVETANPNEYEYMEGSIPSEWDAWIRGRRKEPPSIEELLKNERYRVEIKQKARDADERDLLLQSQAYEEGLLATPSQTAVKGHASSTSFGRPEISEEPTSDANTFQPGSWTPNAKK